MAAINAAYLANTFAVPESNVQSLLDAPTIELAQSFLHQLTTFAKSHQELKSEKLRTDIELEAAVRSGESRTRQLKDSLEKSLKETEVLRRSLNDAENARATLASELQELKSSSNTSSAEVQTLQSRIATLEASNRDKISLMDRKSTAYDQLAEELTAQQQKITELRREVSELEQKLQRAESMSLSTKFREQNLQQEVDLLKKSNEWHEDELKRRTTEQTKYRKEKNAQIAELQRLNEDATQTIESLKRTETALRSRVEDGIRKIEDLHNRIQVLEEEAGKSQESFSIDLGNAQRLADLQQQRAVTSQARLKEVEQERDQIREDAADEIGQLQAEVESERSEKENIEHRITEFESQIEHLEAELSESRRNVPSTPRRGVNGTTTPMRGGSPALFTSPGGSRLKSGLSVTQLYTEHAQLKQDLQAERRRNEKLKDTVDEMIRDLEKHQPEFDEIRMDRERLQANLEEIASLLDETKKERDIARKETKQLAGQTDGLSREAELLRQQLRDLSTQIKILLVEAQAREEGIENLSPTQQAILEQAARGEIDDSEIDSMSDTGLLISQRLTVYRNIEGLQEQNIKLLGLTRKLGEEMEGEEAKAKESQHQRDLQELEELRERIHTHSDEMKSLNIRAESYVRERDMFRRMLAHRGQLPADTDIQSMFGDSVNANSLRASAGPAGASQINPAQSANEAANFNKLLKEMQSQYDAYRQEASTDQAALREQINKVVKEKNDLQTEIARASSQVSLSQERYELLHSNFSMLKTENSELQKRTTSLAEIATKQDIRTQQVAEELIEARSVTDGLRNETANLKAERELWKKIEARLTEDHQQLLEERSRLNKMISDLQSLQNERELADSETRRRLQSRTDNLESELQTTKRKLEEELEKNEKASQRREYEQEQNRTRVEDLLKGLSNTREELVAAKTQRDQLQARVDELKIELRNAEEKTQVLQPLLTSRPGNSGNLDDQENRLSAEQELGMQVADLRRDLDLARNDLLQANEHVEQYKSISQAAEEELQSLTDTHDQYREETDRHVTGKDSKIADLEKRVEEISSELASTNDELSELRSRQDDASSKFNDQKAILEAEITRLKDEADRLTEMSKLHQADLKAQAEIAQRAQQSYEDELVKHAEAAKLLQVIRTEYNQLKTEVAGYRADAEVAKANLSESEETWSETKIRYEHEITDLKNRREDVISQNRRLHQQFEAVSAQIAALKQSHTSSGESTAPDSGSNRDEIITWLKNEKEIVEVQLELSIQEAKRYKQKLDRTESQLDETTEKLSMERQSQTDRDQTSMSHSKLMESINQLNLFRESNASLRNEARQAQSQLAQKTKDVDSLNSQLEPLRLRIREVENQLESNEGELRLLQEDRDRWQQRTQDILSKYDRVDPVEMESLNNQISTLTAERDQLLSDKTSLQTQVDGIDERIKAREETLTTDFNERRTKLIGQSKEKAREQSGIIREKTAQLETTQAELAQLKEELTSIKAELATAKATPAIAPTTVQPTTNTESVNGTELVALQEQNSSLASQLSEEQSRRTTLESEIQTLQGRIQELEAQVIEIQNSLASTRLEKDKLQVLVENQEPGQIQDDDSEKLRAELATVKAELAAKQSQVAGLVPTDATSLAPETLEAPVADRRAELEKEYLERTTVLEQQFKDRADKMKTSLNNKLKELRQKDREEAEALKAEHAQELEKLKEQHATEIGKLKSEHLEELAQSKASAAPATTATAPTTGDSKTITELSDAELKDFMAKNETANAILRRNIQAHSKKTEDRVTNEWKEKLDVAAKAAQTAQENAVLLEQKRQNVKLTMADRKTKDALAKIEVVDKAATDTPQRPVAEVWAIAKVTKAVINLAPAQTNAIASTPTTALKTPAAVSQIPQTPAAVQSQQVPSVATTTATTAAPATTSTANGPATAPTNSSLPSKPPQPQVGGNRLSISQAGTGIPRPGGGGRGRGQDGGFARGGSGIPRGGRGGTDIPRGGNRGRGQTGRGDLQHVNTTSRGGRGGGAQNAPSQQNSNQNNGGGNSPMNPKAKQFQPGPGGGNNKRPHEDPSGGNAEKRVRSGQ